MSNCPQPPAENPWRKGIQGMSFPRSGHHLLGKLLAAYFGPSFNYCEAYHGCQTFPCVRTLNNYQKCHDLQLDHRKSPGVRYLVQIRHPWPAIVSRFKHRVGLKRVGNDRASWETHRRVESQYYAHFVQKWVRQDGIERLLVPYHLLVTDPFETLCSAIRFFDADVDPDGVRASIEKNDVQKKRSWEAFAFYTHQAFEEVSSVNSENLPLV
jgi:hypothetical protein